MQARYGAGGGTVVVLCGEACSTNSLRSIVCEESYNVFKLQQGCESASVVQFAIDTGFRYGDSGEQALDGTDAVRIELYIV